MKGSGKNRALMFTVLVLFLAFLTYQYQSMRQPNYSIEVVASYPHDPESFTQGLIYHDGVLYEGTGLYGKSSLRRVNPESGEVLQIIDLPPYVFGEGVTILNGKVYMLTWKEMTCYVYDLDLEPHGTFAYPTEGWGLTHNGTFLFMSDGSSTLRFIDPDTFQVVQTITVVFDGEPVDNLNELEYIDGVIYANIWLTDQIALIDPMSGNVVEIIDFSSLKNELETDQIDVLNGIAYNPETETIYITGKLWPKLFEVKLVK